MRTLKVSLPKTISTLRGMDTSMALERVLVESHRKYRQDSDFHGRVDDAVGFAQQFFVRDDGEGFDETDLNRLRIVFTITFYLEELKKEDA